jgi:hypothetical protein
MTTTIDENTFLQVNPWFEMFLEKRIENQLEKLNLIEKIDKQVERSLQFHLNNYTLTHRNNEQNQRLNNTHTDIQYWTGVACGCLGSLGFFLAICR